MEPWLSKLHERDVEGAWDCFIERYRRLIFATIRHYAEDYDDVMDIFAWMCEALRQDDLARLRRYPQQKTHSAQFSTWLVAVVRNQTIDWFRHRKGRQRLSSIVQELPPVRQRIFQYVFQQSHSHVEAYELLRTRDGMELQFGEFLREVHATYQALSNGRKGRVMRELVGPFLPDPDLAIEAPQSPSDTAERLRDALASLSPADRLAVQLFVIDELPAADVARIVGWPNAKKVYNRVYRALAAIRADFERQGIGLGDL